LIIKNRNAASVQTKCYFLLRVSAYTQKNSSNNEPVTHKINKSETTVTKNEGRRTRTRGGGGGGGGGGGTKKSKEKPSPQS